MADYEDFYNRRLYRRIEDCWNRPISSNPGAHIDVMKRSRKSLKHPFEYDMILTFFNPPFQTC